jgi:hypothetical protein
VSAGPGAIERETPYCYGVKSLGGKSVALDKFTFELARDREARARFAGIWPTPGFVMVCAPDEPTLRFLFDRPTLERIRAFAIIVAHGSILLCEHKGENARGLLWIGRVIRAKFEVRIEIDPMQAAARPQLL